MSITKIKNIPIVYNLKMFGALVDGVTDDTIAFQRAINYILTETERGGDLFIPAGDCMIGGALQTSVNGTNPNSQLYFPACTSPFIERRSIRIIGEGIPSLIPVGGGWTLANIDGTNIGSRIISTLTSVSGTKPAIFGYCTADMGIPGYPFNANLNITEFQNITIVQQANVGSGGSKLECINASEANSFKAKNCAFTINSDVFSSSEPSSTSCGVSFGYINSDSPNFLESCVSIGFYNGYNFGEHVQLNDVTAYGCYNGYNIQPAAYCAVSGRISAYWTKNIIVHSGAYAHINFQMVEIETDVLGKWYQYDKFIVDSGNTLFGRINYHIVQSLVGKNNAQFAKTGGTNLISVPSDETPPLAGTKIYYVSDTSGGAVTRKLTFKNGILISET